MKNFSPTSQQQNERLIARDQRAFSAGAWDDISSSKIPPNGVKWLQNYIAYDDRLEGRGGSKRWAEYRIPQLLSGLTLTKSGSTVTATAQLSGISVGDFVHYDDGGYDLVIDVAGSPNTCIVDTSTTHAASTAAWVSEPIYGLGYHADKQILALHIGAKLYVANHDMSSGGTYSLAAAGWNRIYPFSAYGHALAKNYSDIQERGDFLVMFNDAATAATDAGGIFVLNLKRTPIECYKINTPVPTFVPTHSYGTVKSDTNKYGYRYLYTLTKQYNASPSLLNHRATSGQVIELESGPLAANASTYKDFVEVWTSTKVGPGTASENYDVWTGGALPAGFDTVAEFAAISDGQFKITVNSTQYNIKCNFTGVTSFAEVAEEIQISLRDYLPNMLCEFVAASNVFRIYQLVKGTDISAFAAGDGGTSIHTVFSGGSAVSTAWDVVKTLRIGDWITHSSLSSQYALWTHVSLYRTLDTGEAGIDPITGQGNNKELYTWVADYPIVKPFKCSTVTADGVTTLTATSSVFSALDVGNEIWFTEGGSATILTYVSGGNVVTIDALEADVTNVSVVINALNSYLGTQSGYIVTTASTADLAAGQRIFWQNGTTAIVTGITNATTFTVDYSQTIGTSIAFTNDAVGNISGSDSDVAVLDNVSDDTLATRVANFSLKNRFFSAMPNCNTGMISNGFMVGAIRNAKHVAYCQVPEGFEYLWGYHNSSKQIFTFKDTITRLVLANDNVIVFCRGTIHRIPLNNYIESKIESVGEVVIVLTGSAVVSPDIGCQDFGAIKAINGYSIIFISSENELKLLQYTEGVPTISDDLAKGRFSKRLRTNIGRATITYDKVNGLMLWIKTTSWIGRTYSTSGLVSERLDTSYRFALNKDQGIGVSENTGTSWLYPPSGISNLSVFDTSKQIRTLILDAADGYLYDVTSRENASGATTGRIWKDKIVAAGTGGVDIAPNVWWPLDEGERKRFFLQHKNSHAFTEPFDRDKADDSGYDSNGYPSDIEFDLTLFSDGNINTIKARAKDVDFSGDIVFDRAVRAHGMQLKLSVNKAEHIVTARLQEYEVEDKADVPDNNYTTEMDHQEDLGNVDCHLFPSNGSLINRATGSAPTTNAGTLVAGPDGGTTAIQLSANTIQDTNKSLSYSGDFAVRLTVSAIDATGTYFYIGDNFSVRVYLDGATYKCAVLYNAATTTVSLGWDGTDWCDIVVSRSGTTLSIFEGV